jgi:hypothetical protein
MGDLYGQIGTWRNSRPRRGKSSRPIKWLWDSTDGHFHTWDKASIRVHVMTGLDMIGRVGTISKRIHTVGSNKVAHSISEPRTNPAYHRASLLFRFWMIYETPISLTLKSRRVLQDASNVLSRPVVEWKLARDCSRAKSTKLTYLLTSFLTGIDGM